MKNFDEEINNQLKELENENINENNNNLNENENEILLQTTINESELTNFISNLNHSSNNIVFLLSQSHSYIQNLNSNINNLINNLQKIYSLIFPELQTIITNPFYYVKTIEIIEKNNWNFSNINLSFLPENIFLAFSMAFSSQKEKILKQRKKFIIENKNENNHILIKKLYNLILKLFSFKEKLNDFSIKNINLIAPNLTELLGANIAGKLIIKAGGIVQLANTPSGNILNMGTYNINLNGFSSFNKFNNGYLTELKEYKNAVDSMKIKVLRRYANKTALAARKDAFLNRSKNNGNNNKENYGTELKKIIADKVEKIKNDV